MRLREVPLEVAGAQSLSLLDFNCVRRGSLADTLQRLPGSARYEQSCGLRLHEEGATVQVPAGLRWSLYFDPGGRLFRIAAIRESRQAEASSDLLHACFTPTPFKDRGGMPALD